MQHLTILLCTNNADKVKVGSDDFPFPSTIFRSVVLVNDAATVSNCIENGFGAHQLQVVQPPVLVDFDQRRPVREHLGVDRLAVKGFVLHLAGGGDKKCDTRQITI